MPHKLTCTEFKKIRWNVWRHDAGRFTADICSPVWGASRSESICLPATLQCELVVSRLIYTIFRLIAGRLHRSANQLIVRARATDRDRSQGATGLAVEASRIRRVRGNHKYNRREREHAVGINCCRVNEIRERAQRSLERAFPRFPGKRSNGSLAATEHAFSGRLEPVSPLACRSRAPFDERIRVSVTVLPRDAVAEVLNERIRAASTTRCVKECLVTESWWGTDCIDEYHVIKTRRFDAAGDS